MDIAKSLFYESFQFEYVIIIATIIAGFCIHGGILDRVVVKSEQWPPQKLVFAYKMSYNKHQADKQFSEVLVMLPTYKKMRIIYDKNLRREGSKPLLIYATGFILNETGSTPEDEVSLFMQELGFKIHQFPNMTYLLTSEHPFRNPLSVKMARARVYSRMKSYIQKRCLCAHPKIEIYGDSSILFLAPLHRQDDFYVKEAEITPSYLLNGFFKTPLPPLKVFKKAEE